MSLMLNYCKSKLKLGFTLIEMLVVIAILGLLATVGLGSFQSSQMKSRDTQRKNDLNQIQKALELYYNDNGKYPLTADFPGAGGSWQDANGTIYMKLVPADPKYSVYFYLSNDGTWYKLYARLENTQDPKYKADGYVGTNCGGELCNYGVASSNMTP